MSAWLFLVAYTCSGLAGLVYEVSWTRLLTLFIGHTTAAASAVVAAFLGGLAVGAAAGGRVASRFSPERSLRAYAALELAVVAAALVLPWELSTLAPALRWAYADGDPGLAFPLIRLAACLALVFLPALALGATFPFAVRWYARGDDRPARAGSVLYVMNTVGAAAGSLVAGFVLIPAVGISGTVRVGMAASIVAALAVLTIVRWGGEPAPLRAASLPRPKDRKKRPDDKPTFVATPIERWVAVAVLGLAGFASLVHEIAWTRVLAMILGPTTYAFSATLAAVIAGIAVGSGAGAWLVPRTRRPAWWLVATLFGAAITAAVAYGLAGSRVPFVVAQAVANAPDTSLEPFFRQGALLALALILPTSACIGAAFPLTLAMASDPAEPAARRFGLVYAINTVGAVAGSLAAGFVLIPMLGLQPTFWTVSGTLMAAALVVLLAAPFSRADRMSGAGLALASMVLIGLSPSWNRPLLASGGYLYAPFVPKGLDLEAMLSAGTLLYYGEGASATVSVKRLTGTTTLAVDGKTDASNRGDMLTQKLIAHLPLLLHDDPKEVAIVGLGSGATLAAALTHPIAHADVLEISPEVVEASRFFEAENHRALDDPRSRLIVGDGRSHLLLASKQYDVIVSEPSNPWIAGVAALFTREFFEAARARLAPGGVMCQWANGYTISDADLRAIVATFLSVFPNGTAWLVGESDVVLVASTGRLDDRIATMTAKWSRPGVSEDLAQLGVSSPFALLSLFVGGPAQLAKYAAGATVFTDDRSRLEFTAPLEIHRQQEGGGHTATLMSLGAEGGLPPAIEQARGSASAADWKSRAAMLAHADAHPLAYDAYTRAFEKDPMDREALAGLAREAMLLKRGADALAWVKALTENQAASSAVLVARSKLLASIGAGSDALALARQAAQFTPTPVEALEQLASLYADAADTGSLDDVVVQLGRAGPALASASYYSAASAFMRGDAITALGHAQRAVDADPTYAAAYDLMGAALTRQGQGARAREAFEKSLALEPHDSTAYTNIGLLELAAGNRREAANYFAEALWLEPDSAAAREGLRQALNP